MKNLFRFFVLLILSIGIIQCDYERIELEACPDDTNPNCPCPNPSNPDCTNNDNTFNTLFTTTELGCSNVKVNEVLELNNNSGFMIAGRCEDKGFVMHVSNDGTEIICSGTFELGANFNFFTSIARTNSNRLITTGYALDGNNTNVFNLLISSAACNQGEESTVDNTTAGIIQPWDQGNSIIADRANNNIIVGGKWEGNPMLIRLTDGNNMTTDDIEDIIVFDSTFFEMNVGVQIASVNSFPIAGHEVTKVIQTGDNGFLATGFVDAWNGTEYVKKVFLVKTNADFSGPILKVYDLDLPYKNTWGFDLMEVDNGATFAIVGLGFNGQTPQNLANASFPVDYPIQGFDGFVLFAKNTDLSFQSYKNWLGTSEEDLVTGIVGKDASNSAEFLVVGQVADATSSGKYTRVLGFTNSGGQIVPTEVDMQFGTSEEISFPNDIIKTSDGEFLIITNVDNTSGGPKGIRLIKTKI